MSGLGKRFGSLAISGEETHSFASPPHSGFAIFVFPKPSPLMQVVDRITTAQFSTIRGFGQWLSNPRTQKRRQGWRIRPRISQKLSRSVERRFD
jgi:hypothetical protein